MRDARCNISTQSSALRKCMYSCRASRSDPQEAVLGNMFGNSRSLTRLEALRLRSLTSDNSATFFSKAKTSSGHDGAGPESARAHSYYSTAIVRRTYCSINTILGAVQYNYAVPT